MKNLNRREWNCLLWGFAFGFITPILILIGLMIWSDHQDPWEGQAVSNDQMSQDEVTERIREALINSHLNDVNSVEDPALRAYISDVLEKQCPFYEPDGVSYRECLWNYVDEKEQAYTKKSPTRDEIADQCESVAAIPYIDIDSLAYKELLLSCLAFKFSQP